MDIVQGEMNLPSLDILTIHLPKIINIFGKKMSYFILNLNSWVERDVRYAVISM